MLGGRWKTPGETRAAQTLPGELLFPLGMRLGFLASPRWKERGFSLGQDTWAFPASIVIF